MKEKMCVGNKICDLAEIELGNSVYKVELNGGTKKEKYDIHLQNEQINICMKDFEFSQFVTALVVANRRMKRFKKIHE